MILEIRLSNFFSIKEEIVLDFRAANINNKKVRTDLQNNTFDFDNIKILKNIFLYGANASGKSSIINAIRFCHGMVYNSHNHNENTVFRFAPFKFSSYPKKPSTYFIRFVVKEVEYEYAFSLTRTEIVKESLYYYPNGRIKKIFERDETKGTGKSEIYSFGKDINRPLDVAENTSKKTLYLTRASQMDRNFAKEIFHYFANVCILHWRNPIRDVNRIEKLFETHREHLLEALQIADSDIIDMKMKREKQASKNVTANFSSGTATVGDAEQDVLRITAYHKKSPKVPFDFSEESAGTQKLFAQVLTILEVISMGGSLIIDELETHLHPLLTDYIFQLFNASEKSQLLCSTHNTNLMDLNKVRKDQIYFTHKKEDASTDLYSLYDYKDFREGMDLEKAYLQGRFDAIPIIDSSLDNIKSIINE